MHIIVVGSGVSGASAAFHAARLGAQVTVIDAGLDGRATAAGAGIVCPWVSNVEDAAFYRLYTASGEYYPTLIAQLAEAGQTDLGYRRSGAMLVTADADEFSRMERVVRQRQAQAPAMGEVSRLGPAEARGLFPPLREDLSAIHVAGGARIDGRRLAAALLAAAVHHGAVMRSGMAALAGPRSVMVDNERLDADRLIVTAGAWASPLLHRLGMNLPVAPQRGQIVHLQLAGAASENWPVILPPGSHYIVSFDDGRIVAGATREAESGFDYRVTASGQAEVLAEALRIAPGLGSATLLETRVGFRPVGRNVRPFLGWMPGESGLAVGNGLGAAGLTIGPFAGRLLADLVLGQPPLLDLAPFDPSRRVATDITPSVALR